MVHAETLKHNIAPMSAYVLLEWCSAILQEIIGTKYWLHWGHSTIESNMRALDICLASSKRSFMRRSAHSVTWRCLRKIVAKDPSGEIIGEAIIKLCSKTSQPTPKNALMLGAIAGVCARHPEAKQWIETRKSDYYKFYIREIIGSRVQIPPYLANALEDFFSNYPEQNELEKELAPALEKALLRAPEIVLNDLLTPLMSSLSSPIDVSNILQNNLLKLLISTTKSSNPNTRRGALLGFKAAILKCHDAEVISRICNEILSPLEPGKSASVDQRVTHAEMLTAVALSNCKVTKNTAIKAASVLALVAGKETNETALTAETSALLGFLTCESYFDVDIDIKIIEIITKGISDKKVTSKKIWMNFLGELYSIEETRIQKIKLSSLTETILQQLLNIWKDVNENSLSAGQSGLVTCAYILVTIFCNKLAHFSNSKVEAVLSRAHISEQALMTEPRLSFLLNPRVYGKLSCENDFKWFLQALTSLSKEIITADFSSPMALAWAQAGIFCICSSNANFMIQKNATKELSKLYVLYPSQISRIIIAGLWRWFNAIEVGEKDSAAVIAKTGNRNLHHVIKSICPSTQVGSDEACQISKTIRRDQMTNLLILCRSKLIPGINWVDLCLRTGVDPGQLARDYVEPLVHQIQKYSSFNGKEPSEISISIKEAAFNAAADLAFVAPEIMTERIMALVKEDLDSNQLSDISQTDAAIFHTKEGTLFVDVLASNSQKYQQSKNIKDYDTLKWEADLKAQLAQKKGQQKKLTPEENAKVSAQIKKETEIRQNIRQIEAKILRGTGIICSLVSGPPTDASLWMRPAVEYLLGIISAGASLIVGNAASNAFISCGSKLPCSRISDLGPFIGVATLRALDVPQLPQTHLDEPIGALITRVLYRLRFSAEQRPLDNVSLIYVLPLILLVLRKNGFGERDDADAQLVLALEFLSFHTNTFSDVLVPREETLSVLIVSMQTYNQYYKIIRDCLADLCRCIAPNITKSEIGILLRGTIVPQRSVCTSILQFISADIDLSELDFSDEIWLACHDDEEEIVKLGQEIWEESGFKLTETTPFKILPYLEQVDIKLRIAAAKALSEAVEKLPDTLPEVLRRLKLSYQDLAKPRVPQLDEYGMPKSVNLSDPWEARHGISLAFKEMSPLFSDQLLDSLLQFLIESGPLGDKIPKVREEFIDTAVSIITLHGKSKVEDLMKTFEQTLEAPDKSSEFADRVNEAVIIMYGALARHLEPGDNRVPKVTNRLLETLSTPSEAVQYAVAECLPPLVRASSSSIPDYMQYTLERLFNSKSYAARRGAAYGLAGVVHGKGISALREFRIMSTLKAGTEKKNDANHREGSLLAYELLSTILGRLFEPYVIEIVPQLLGSFGDTNADVRDSCLAAAKACFARLSSFGVKRILPTLLDGLDDSQWRSKKGACDLLGAMAFLDPQQLAQSLPEIIPPLTSVLNDSHKEVRLAANRSLKRFGEVINNPEIKSLVDIILKALSDPTKYTEKALDSLIKVSFVHYLDAPSLALVVRILERGLGDRSTTKRKSSQVIGSLAHLTERKDLVSHLPILVAGLKIAIVDPVPTTRATASKALGSLVEKLGEDALPDLIPGLMQTLKSETSAGDRLGSAQALSEVLAGLGTLRLDETLPTILQNASSPKPGVREGFISLFIFLPVCFGNSFANYLSQIIPILLQGLADDVESIRETSLRAGRLLVRNFSSRSVELLLPELERGLTDDNYRIRLSSVELIGDLLFNLTGIKAESEQDEEDMQATGAASATLLAALGEEKRNKVLSALYICRCDTSGLVRTAAVGVWKALVASPKALKELIPTLTKLIINRLGSSLEQKVIAGNALSELVRKTGDDVLSSLLPVLEKGLKSTDANAKQGICIALRELIGSASSEALADHEKTLTSVVRIALTDPNGHVREAAAEAFDSLQQILGKRAIDQVLPYLLNLLRTESDAKNALAALLTLLTETTRSSIILPNLIPTLITPPISSFNAKALASLATVAGPAMTRRMPVILMALIESIVTCEIEETIADLDASLETVILSIDEFDGLNTVMSVLLNLTKHEDQRKRAVTDRQLAKFFGTTTIDYSRYNQDIIRALLISFSDRDHDVVQAAWDALNEFTKHLRKEEMEKLVFSTRQTLQSVGIAGVDLPGFSLPKGINAILPIFLQGLMNGTAEQRAQSALAISDIVDRANGDSLKPFVAQITGPLIRVISSERSIDTKTAILFTLTKLLEKIPILLKPFLPQLQRTFAKCLADTSSETMRTRAALALGTLITLTPRIDPLVAELCTGARTSDPGVRESMLKALYEVVDKAGANMSDASRTAVLTLIDANPTENNISMAITNSKLLAALVKHLSTENVVTLTESRIFKVEFSPSSILALNAILSESPSSITNSISPEDLVLFICKGMSSKNLFILDNCILAGGKYLLSDIRTNDFEILKSIFESLASLIKPGNPMDTRRLALVVIRTVCRHHTNIVRPHLPVLVSSIFASVRDAVIPIKLAAEAAFITLFCVADEGSRVFDKFIASQELPGNQAKSMQDYFKRVALRLGNTARERREAEGGEGGLGLSNDEVDDEREIWSIGKVELGEEAFAV
ncbi:eIF-2-alpha kinase activator [Podosphaera aphanis]|nr:eIF-2-alpha kinase activator [Podosphaera aphanis]